MMPVNVQQCICFNPEKPSVRVTRIDPIDDLAERHGLQVRRRKYLGQEQIDGKNYNIWEVDLHLYEERGNPDSIVVTWKLWMDPGNNVIYRYIWQGLDRFQL